MVSQSLGKSFWSSPLQNRGIIVVHYCVAKTHVTDDVATCTIDFPAFTLLVAKFVDEEGKKGSLEKEEMDDYLTVSKR